MTLAIRDYEMDTIPEEEELLAQLGVTLILLQDLEQILCHCMKLVFGDKRIITVDEFLGPDRWTLGAFVSHLRKTVILDESFEQMLNDLVEERNIFAHRLREQPWFNTETKDGREATWRFLISLFQKIEEATHIFHSFAFKQIQESSMPKTPEEQVLLSRGYLQRLEKKYFPVLPQLVKGKR